MKRTPATVALVVGLGLLLTLGVLFSRVGKPAPATNPAATGSLPAPIAQLVQAASGAQPQATPLDDTPTLLARARQLVQAGDYGSAVDLFDRVAERAGEEAALARLEEARAAQLDEDHETAIAALDRLVRDHPTSAEATDAFFVLARSRRALGDYPGALRALQEYEARAGQHALTTYLWLERAALYAALGDHEHQRDAAELAADDPAASRRARIEALEDEAEAYQELGDREAAIERYDQALNLAATRSYRAEILYLTGALYRDLGEERAAVDRLRALVVDYPEQARARTALGILQEMGYGNVVSPYQVGLVRQNALDYAGAQAAFEQVGSDEPQAGLAAYYRAVALLRLGDEPGAVQALRDAAEAYPAQAAMALLRAGKLLESSGYYAEADEVYERLFELAPASPSLPEARFRQGFTRFLRDNLAGALALWDEVADPASEATPALRAQTHFWRGKALQRTGDAAGARDAWSAAEAASPDTYYGLRADDLLAGRTEPVNQPAPRDTARLSLASEEGAERDAWLARAGEGAASAASDLARDPSVVRAEHLLRLGLTSEAIWELEDVLARAASTRNAPLLAALADHAAQRGLVNLSLKAGLAQRDLAGGRLSDLPRALQRYVYPAGWGDLAFVHAGQRGVDPLLLLGLVRQESSFDPRAQSSAQAMGLAQVMPATGADIARGLGRADQFHSSDLFRPTVSLEFGSVYLAEQLKRYDGRILPALAGYNAGPGNVDRWLRASSGDPDVFVEEIPFAETYGYVKVVYENYRLYERLYGG